MGERRIREDVVRNAMRQREIEAKKVADEIERIEKKENREGAKRSYSGEAA